MLTLLLALLAPLPGHALETNDLASDAIYAGAPVGA